MTKSEINEAIAKHLDWEWVSLPVSGSPMGWLDDKGEYRLMGRFTEDLNAMHEAEKALSRDEVWSYNRELSATQGLAGGGLALSIADYTWHATARQRAEAFLKAVGKWEGGE